MEVKNPSPPAPSLISPEGRRILEDSSSNQKVGIQDSRPVSVTGLV